MQLTTQKKEAEEQMMTEVDGTEYRKTLDDYIGELSREGYNLMARSETTAQLIKPKKFSTGWALFWFLGFGIGIVVYLIYYMGKKDELVFLQERDGYITGLPPKRKQYAGSDDSRRFLLWIGLVGGWILIAGFTSGFYEGLFMVPSGVGILMGIFTATGLAYLVIKKFW